MSTLHDRIDAMDRVLKLHREALIELADAVVECQDALVRLDNPSSVTFVPTFDMRTGLKTEGNVIHFPNPDEYTPCDTEPDDDAHSDK